MIVTILSPTEELLIKKLLSAAENIISYKLVVDSVGCDRSRRCVEEESHKSLGLSVSVEFELCTFVSD